VKEAVTCLEVCFDVDIAKFPRLIKLWDKTASLPFTAAFAFTLGAIFTHPCLKVRTSLGDPAPKCKWNRGSK